MSILKADIDQRAKEIGLTPSQVTPTIRVAIWDQMISEQTYGQLLAAASGPPGTTPTRPAGQ